MKTWLNLGLLSSPFVFQFLLCTHHCTPNVTGQALQRANSYHCGETKPHVANNKSGMKWGSGFSFALVWYIVICSVSVCSSRPCAPRAFPWECGLLFRTPRIASGGLLVHLMWAKQRGNKEYGNLQRIAELKTSPFFTQIHTALSHAQTQEDTQGCVHIVPVLQTWTCCI